MAIDNKQVLLHYMHENGCCIKDVCPFCAGKDIGPKVEQRLRQLEGETFRLAKLLQLKTDIAKDCIKLLEEGFDKNVH